MFSSLGEKRGLMGLTMPQPAAPMAAPPAPVAATQPPQPAQPVPDQAQPPAAPEQQGGGRYNGDIRFQGKTMTVKDGQTQDKQGNTYIVADDGSIVTDAKDRRIVGHVENGEFVPITAEYLKKLESHGIVEKPQGEQTPAPQ